MKSLARSAALLVSLALGSGSAIAQEATSAPQQVAVPDYSQYILTPPAPDVPRVNGAPIFGVRPGNPFLYTIPATGMRPMKFGAIGLPEGLTVDADTGCITGKIETAGEYKVTLTADNERGKATKDLKIVCGDTIALTPPLGYNSWNAGGPDVNADKIRAAAKAMVEKGLINHGWQYINIDDAWQGTRGGEFEGIQSNEKFPDMKALADEIHAMGLKIGIYSTPWMTSYAGFNGGSAAEADGKWDKASGRRDGKVLFATNDAKQWAAWGIDYLKYDWNPRSNPRVTDDFFEKQVKDMADALRASGRDIVYSYSNSMPFDAISRVAGYLNAWRTSGDIRDNWQSMSSKGFGEDKWAEFSKPGHWNDPDMLVVGIVGWRARDIHYTKLTPDEQYTHISLWALVNSPMLIGCDMAKLDDFTVSLLSNDEILAVSQDALGKQAVHISSEDNPEDSGADVTVDKKGRRTETPKKLEVLAKPMEDGSYAAGLFNRSTKAAKVTLKFSDLKSENLKVEGKWRVRDLWRQKDLGSFENEFTADVNPHGVMMVQLFREK